MLNCCSRNKRSAFTGLRIHTLGNTQGVPSQMNGDDVTIKSNDINSEMASTFDCYFEWVFHMTIRLTRDNDKPNFKWRLRPAGRGNGCINSISWVLGSTYISTHSYTCNIPSCFDCSDRPSSGPWWPAETETNSDPDWRRSFKKK